MVEPDASVVVEQKASLVKRDRLRMLFVGMSTLAHRGNDVRSWQSPTTCKIPGIPCFIKTIGEHRDSENSHSNATQYQTLVLIQVV